MDYYDDGDSVHSLSFIATQDDNVISHLDKYDVELKTFEYKQEALRPQKLLNLNRKEVLLLNLYKLLNLTTEQKRDFHVLLIRMKSIKDLITLSKDIYNDISGSICCSDKRCICDPTNQFRQLSKPDRQNQQNVSKRNTFRKISEDYKVKKLNELKDSNKKLARINKQLIKLRAIIQHGDEDRNNFCDLLLLQRDVAYQKDILFVIDEKLRRYM